LDQVRAERLHPNGKRLRSGRREVRAATLRVDGACLPFGRTPEEIWTH
jgi:hypothetical protein